MNSKRDCEEASDSKEMRPDRAEASDSKEVSADRAEASDSEEVRAAKSIMKAFEELEEPEPQLEEPAGWTSEETDLFFKAIEEYGADTNLISLAIPGKSFADVKQKYIYEENKCSCTHSALPSRPKCVASTRVVEAIAKFMEK